MSHIDINIDALEVVLDAAHDCAAALLVGQRREDILAACGEVGRSLDAARRERDLQLVLVALDNWAETLADLAAEADDDASKAALQRDAELTRTLISQIDSGVKVMIEAGRHD